MAQLNEFVKNLGVNSYMLVEVLDIVDLTKISPQGIEFKWYCPNNDEPVENLKITLKWMLYGRLSLHWESWLDNQNAEGLRVSFLSYVN